MVTWGQVKLLLAQALQTDGASEDDTNNTVMASAFDLRANILLQMFVRLTYYIWVDRAVLTLATNDQRVNLLDIAKCGYPIYKPTDVWVSGQRVAMYSPSDQRIQFGQAAAVASGLPTTWSSPDEGVLLFEVKCSSGFSNSFVSGFTKHPQFTDDTNPVQIQEWHIFTLVKFMAAAFAENVVSSDVALARLQMRDKASYEQIAMIKAEKLKRFAGTKWIG